MSTTTIRLEEDLKAKVSAVAKSMGKTTHSFILDAIAQTVEQVEADQEFYRLADERWLKVLATGNTIPWEKAQAYLEARLRGEKARKPAARKLKR